MTMREKVKELMSILMTPVDKTADQLVDAFKHKFEEGFGQQVSPEALEGIALIDNAAIARRGALEDAIAGAFEQHFIEEEVDTLLAFYKSPAYAKLSSASNDIQATTADATSAWVKDLMTSIEPDLAKLLGGPEDGATTSILDPIEVIESIDPNAQPTPNEMLNGE